ncbi:MAG: outer membrane beta-barrel domain-containing protein [Myxococcota bacterium]|jgi:outer membrane beta-barrel protein
MPRLIPLIGLAMTLLSAVQARAESPGIAAIEDYKAGRAEKQAVENRFFLKQGRFEISPILGYVPNNPFARRYLGGAIVGYHLSEQLSFQAQLMYSPDLGENDVKGLTSVLLDRAYQASADNEFNFQQPLDKAALTGAFGVGWSPFYGKINLVGETVLNFDFYLFGGAGMVSKKNFIAVYDPTNIELGDNLDLQAAAQAQEVKIAPFVGIGQNYFVNRLMAVKIDIRAAFYVDGKPQYDPDVEVTEQRLYNNVIATTGLAFFFPNMKPRLYNF